MRTFQRTQEGVNRELRSLIDWNLAGRPFQMFGKTFSGVPLSVPTPQVRLVGTEPEQTEEERPAESPESPELMSFRRPKNACGPHEKLLEPSVKVTARPVLNFDKNLGHGKLTGAFRTLGAPWPIGGLSKLQWFEVQDLFRYARYCYLERSKENHPDKGGLKETMVQINRAWDFLREVAEKKGINV